MTSSYPTDESTRLDSIYRNDARIAGTMEIVYQSNNVYAVAQSRRRAEVIE